MKRKICSHCRRPATVCYCHTIKSVTNAWPVQILQHPAESNHAIGTARIAQLSLSRCRLQVGEHFDRTSVASGLAEELEPILVYPDESATPVEELDPQQPRMLLFLDASWRKSRRMLHESSYLRSLPKISLQPRRASHYRIRKVPGQYALSTLEAIVSVLSILEGKDNQYQPLLDSMDWMIEKQIELMGREVFQLNYKDKD